MVAERPVQLPMLVTYTGVPMAMDEDVVKMPLVTLPLRASSVPGMVVASTVVTVGAPLHVEVTGERMLCEAESEKVLPTVLAM